MILVFKTGVGNLKQVKSIAKALDDNSKIQSWNFDLGDIDKILRIVSELEIEEEIIEIMNQHSLHCEALV